MLNRSQIQTANFAMVWLYICVLWALLNNHLKHQAENSSLLFAGVALALSISASIFNYWRLQKLSEAAVSKIASVAQGYIELLGTANADQPLKTPYQGISCVWFSVSAYADVPGDDESAPSSRLLEYKQSEQPFKLSDETGFCMVNPKGAEIVHLSTATYRKNNHRYVESYLPANAKLHVIGHLDTRHDFNTRRAINQDVSKLLAELKANKTQLLNRYDQNRDGEIDLQEWEQVRAEALRQVEANHATKAQVNFFTLSKPSDGQLFLISALSPQEMRVLLSNWHRIHLAAAIFFSMAMLKLI